MARRNNDGFLAGLVLGGLVGAALALLATPRGGRLAQETLQGLGATDAEAALERGRDALRARIQQAAAEAQQAATDTAQRLQAEYRGARDSR